MDMEAGEAARLVAAAVEKGINYFDVAPSYGDAEVRLGPALEPHRDGVFLACKTTERLAEGARAELDQSLERLRTDHLDLYQFHGLSKLEDVDRIMGPGGALEVFEAARERGQIRHIGFSAHNEEAALRMLDAYPFDSVLLPINVACWTRGGFGARVVERARERGTGVLALKCLAKRPVREGETNKWSKTWYVPADTLSDVTTAVSFTLSRPVTAALCPGHAELLWLACEALDALSGRPSDAPADLAAEWEPIFSAEG